MMATTEQIDLFALLCAESAPVAAPVQARPRHYYRCMDCLTVAATEEKLPENRQVYGPARVDAACDACGGGIEYMGVVVRETVQHVTGYRAICDGKCISARGPSCDCKCGGENHGSGMVVPVIETSGIPRLGIKGPQAKLAGEIWRGLIARYKLAWKARYGYVVEQKNLGRYLDGSEFARYREAGQTTSRFYAIRDGRTAARGRKLEALIAEISAVRP